MSVKYKYLRYSNTHIKHYLGHIKKQEVIHRLEHFKELTQTPTLFVSSSVLRDFEEE